MITFIKNLVIVSVITTGLFSQTISVLAQETLYYGTEGAYGSDTYFYGSAGGSVNNETYFYGSAPSGGTTGASETFYYGSAGPTGASSETYYFGSNPTTQSSETFYYGSTPTTVSNGGNETFYYGSAPTTSNSETYYYGSTPTATNSSETYYYGSTPTTTGSETYYYGSTPSSSSETYYYGSTPATLGSETYYYGSTPSGNLFGSNYGSVNYGVVDYGSTNYGSVNYGAVNYGSSMNYGTVNYGNSWTGVTTGCTYNCGTTINTSCPSGTTLINGTCQINTITCPAGTTRQNNICVPAVQCPSGTNLQNGVCVPQTQCPNGTTLINGVCQINTTQCPAGTTLVNGTCQAQTSCPSGTTLINGTCQINTTSCPAGTTLVNGTCQINTTTCPQGSTLVNGVCQAPITCPAGTTLQNGVCVGTGTTTCPAGTTLINGVCQINTTSCPAGSHLVNGVCQINATQCPTGSVFQNGICVVQNVVTNYTCPNGQVVSNLYACPVTYGQTSYTQSTVPIVYQTCWDGSVIPNTSVCPAQYKVCANGTSIPIHQQCYVPPTPVYVAPPTIKFNNVVTSPATQITINSARCNGIGLIAQGAQSTGWFEYGQTPNLGRQTNPAIIGTAATAPFSNVLTNLQPSTTYYCRAVMQNQYGLVKGEIIHFTTKSKAVNYVAPKPAAPKAPSKKAPAPAKKSNEIICADGSVVSVGSKSTATMLSEGQKLIAVQIAKGTPEDPTPGKMVSYHLTYKNLSDTMISGATIKIVVPQEFEITGAPGGYDAATRTITLSGVSMAPYSQGGAEWVGRVSKDAQVGKTVVTTAYILYTVPGTQVQDEVTAYTTSSISAPADIGKLSGAKNVVGTAPTFLPNTLVEWLALIAILFIIFVLGRSIAQSYKKGGESHH